MFIKLFVLGRPGCGKSKTAKHITKFIEPEGWVTYRFKDYDILEMMFKKDVSQKRFRPCEQGGFDVLDVSAFDEALNTLGRDIDEYILNIKDNTFIVIEFARDNYEQAFKQFSPAFLQDAHFLLVDTALETCKQRIIERTAHPDTPDDHFISDYALNTYYHGQYLPRDTIILERFVMVENQSSWQEFTEKINTFIKNIL